MAVHRAAALALTFGAACIALFPPPASGADTAVRVRIQPPAWVAFTRAWAAVTGYSATVKVFERKGSQVQNVVFDYNFRKPSNATVRVVEGPNAGVTLVWNGGPTMKAHRGSGFIAQFKRTMSLHDPLATTIRGSSIDQLSFGAILTHAQDTPGAISQRRGPAIGGVATDSVTLIPTSAVKNTGLTREVVEISRTTHFPVRVFGYAGQTLVRTIEYSKVKLQQ